MFLTRSSAIVVHSVWTTSKGDGTSTNDSGGRSGWVGIFPLFSADDDEIIVLLDVVVSLVIRPCRHG